MKGHTRDIYYKLIGYSASQDFKNKKKVHGSRATNTTYNVLAEGIDFDSKKCCWRSRYWTVYKFRNKIIFSSKS